jgi:hypothetical protein
MRDYYTGDGTDGRPEPFIRGDEYDAWLCLECGATWGDEYREGESPTPCPKCGCEEVDENPAPDPDCDGCRLRRCDRCRDAITLKIWRERNGGIKKRGEELVDTWTGMPAGVIDEIKSDAKGVIWYHASRSGWLPEHRVKRVKSEDMGRRIIKEGGKGTEPTTKRPEPRQIISLGYGEYAAARVAVGWRKLTRPSGHNGATAQKGTKWE